MVSVFYAQQNRLARINTESVVDFKVNVGVLWCPSINDIICKNVLMLVHFFKYKMLYNIFVYACKPEIYCHRHTEPVLRGDSWSCKVYV